MKRTVPLIGELRDAPGERRLTPAEQDAERERQRVVREGERKRSIPPESTRA